MLAKAICSRFHNWNRLRTISACLFRLHRQNNKPLRFATAYMIDARACLLFSEANVKEDLAEFKRVTIESKKSLYMALAARLCLR